MSGIKREKRKKEVQMKKKRGTGVCGRVKWGEGKVEKKMKGDENM